MFLLTLLPSALKKAAPKHNHPEWVVQRAGGCILPLPPTKKGARLALGRGCRTCSGSARSTSFQLLPSANPGVILAYAITTVKKRAGFALGGGGGHIPEAPEAHLSSPSPASIRAFSWPVQSCLPRKGLDWPWEGLEDVFWSTGSMSFQLFPCTNPGIFLACAVAPAK